MLCSLSFLLLLGPAGVAAPEPAPGPSPPVFGASTELVVIDAVVTDHHGNPVPDLSATDFQLLEDGVPQEISSFEAFGGTPSGLAEPAAAGGQPAARPIGPSSRAFGIVFDDVHLERGEGIRAKKGIRAFLGLGLPGDVVAVFAPGRGVGKSAVLPDDRHAIDAFLDSLEGGVKADHSATRLSEREAQIVDLDLDHGATLAAVVSRFIQLDPSLKPPDGSLDSGPAIALARAKSAEVHANSMNRAQVTLGGVAEALRWLLAAKGRRSLLLVSSGFAYDSDLPSLRTVVQASLRAQAPIYLLDARGLEGLTPFQGVEYGPAMDQTTLGLMSQSLAGSPGSQRLEEAGGVVSLALDTGGFVARNMNDLRPAFRTIADSYRVYYLLGYHPPGGRADRFRHVKVSLRGELSRSSSVRFRRGYFAPVEPSVAASAADVHPNVLPSEKPKDTSAAMPEPIAALATGGLALAEVLARAAKYLDGYEQKFTNVVATEAYLQEVSLATERSESDAASLARSDLRSDFLFIHLPDATRWEGFRDVFSVNGKMVRDRSARLENLFLNPTHSDSLARARAIVAESARFNIGPGRDFNVPTVPLTFLEGGNQPRFAFKREGSRTVSGTPGLVLSFKEVARPTLIRLSGTDDLPVKGSVVIDPDTGAILQTEFEVVQDSGSVTVSIRIKTTYAFRPEVGLWVPQSMDEACDVSGTTGKSGPRHFVGKASYENYRRFTVTTGESVQQPR